MFAKRAYSSFFKSCDGVKHYSNMIEYFQGENKPIFLLRIKGIGDDPHYLTPDLLQSFHSNLMRVKSEATKTEGSPVLITTAEGQNFCKGIRPEEYKEVIDPFRELVKELICFPMPTIAAINGEARNAGLILAISHDHLTMEGKKQVLRVTELPLPDYFAAVIRSKVVPGAFSRLPLNNTSYTYEEANSILGLAVHPPHGNNEKPLDTAKRVANRLSRGKRNGDVYAEMRKAMHPDLCNVLGLSTARTAHP